jgi:hypothetical protein
MCTTSRRDAPEGGRQQIACMNTAACGIGKRRNIAQAVAPALLITAPRGGDTANFACQNLLDWPAKKVGDCSKVSQRLQYE